MANTPTQRQIDDALLHADHAISGESMMAARHLQVLAAEYRKMKAALHEIAHGHVEGEAHHDPENIAKAALHV